jgi:SPP1 gp7 family putative phage head morphogenesis protein
MAISAAQFSALFDMAPAAALRWLVNKGLRISADPDAMSTADHAAGFGFANLTRLDVAQDIVNGLEDALRNGKTQRQFIDDLRPILQRKGWWGKTEKIDTETGEVKVVRQGSPARLGTIYRTNIFSAYAAGRYESMLANSEDRPYWRYVAVMDRKTRPSHAALHNMVFRFDDPIWEILFPPNGYNCRCRVEALTAEEVRARGYTIHKTVRIVTQRIADPMAPNGEIKVRGVEFTDGSASRTFYPDTGFDNNPALAVYQTNPDRYAVELARPYTGAGLTGAQMTELYHASGTGEILPAAVLDAAVQALWQAPARTVWLTKPALTAQRLAGTLPPLQVMPSVQSVIESPALVVRQGGQIVTFKQIGDTWYRAVIDSETMGVDSYSAVNARDLDKAVNAGEVISGR